MNAIDPSIIFNFGFGYCSEFLAHDLRQANWIINGTTRDIEKKALMQEQGIRAYLFDYRKPLNDPSLFLSGITHLLISTPPDDDGDPTFIMHAEDIAAIPTLKWIGYLSSTAVYGDRAGGWVDEASELRPNNKRGSRRVRAEEQWLSLYHRFGLPVHIFRLAGIYGPGRSSLDSVRAGIARRIDKKGHAFSRVHVEDIVEVLKASMKQPRPGAIYNVADDNAAPSHELITYACKSLNIDAPPMIPYEEADLVPMARSFYKDNKRVRNQLIKDELGVTLKYPDYRLGLQACLEFELQQKMAGDEMPNIISSVSNGEL
jgi:nucleoside-diphosphate-sugar epimerase